MKKRIRVGNKLLATAQRLTGIDAPSALVNAALTALIEKGRAEELAIWTATRPSIESVLGDRMETEPVEVAQALKAAYEAAVEGDRTRAAEMEELRKFDAGTHPTQHSQATYDVWADTKTLAALNDPRPPIEGEVVMKRLARLESRLSSDDEDAIDWGEDPSSTIIEVDGDLFNEADDYVFVETDSELAEAALRVLIDVHSAPPGESHE